MALCLRADAQVTASRIVQPFFSRSRGVGGEPDRVGRSPLPPRLRCARQKSGLSCDLKGGHHVSTCEACNRVGVETGQPDSEALRGARCEP